FGQVPDELLGGLFGGGEPVGLDVVGLHGQRHVHRDDDGGAVAGYAHLVGGAGGGEHEQSHHGQEQRRCDVASPAGDGGGDEREQRQVGEAHGVAAARELRGHIGAGQQRDRREHPQPAG